MGDHLMGDHFVTGVPSRHIRHYAGPNARVAVAPEGKPAPGPCGRER